MSDDEEDFPLADHPGPGGPKAGDPEMNRARDLQHMDVARSRATVVTGVAAALPAERQEPSSFLPSDAPVMIAWNAFRESGGYDKAISQFDLFMAGWAARDAQ